jgi:hypothetical protein
MKHILLSAGIILNGLFAFAQTAPNFTANDCQGNNHDLHTELDAGKVIVISWVMPCSSCINGATYAQNAANSFSLSHPGSVIHYVADDYANTSCPILTNWCSTNSITPNATFSSTLVNMNGYGAAGMPKVVVLAAPGYSVYYNVNNAAITQSGIQTAISNALANVSTGIKESKIKRTVISPNPSGNEIRLTFQSLIKEKLDVEIFNYLGQKVMAFTDILLDNNEVKLNTTQLSNGNYFLRLNSGEFNETQKIVISK